MMGQDMARAADGGNGMTLTGLHGDVQGDDSSCSAVRPVSRAFREQHARLR